jgi:hypothetical protein
MRTVRMAFLFVAALGLASMALAADEAKTVTLTGKIACAKCTLHLEGAKECQNVLVAEQDGKTVDYYIEANDVMKNFGHECHGEKAATVTGTVAEKDGKMWITPTKMESPKA